MKRFLFLGALVVVASCQAFGQKEDDKSSGRDQMQCQMFSLDSARSQISVFTGSGSGGNQPQPPAPDQRGFRYKVMISQDTKMHWQDDTTGRLSLEDLARLSKQQGTVPMTIVYNRVPDTEVLHAREIIIKRPATKQDGPK